EDLNKMIMLSLYNGRHQRIETIVREYAASEFGEDYADRMTRLILLLDQTLIRRRQDEDGTNCDYPPRGYVWKGKPRFVIVNPEPVLEASELADQLQQQLPARIRQSW